MDLQEAFGSEGQKAVQRRVAQLWSIIGDDPRFCSHGRAIALTRADPDTIPVQIALARLLGVSACDDVPEDAAPARRAALAAAGLKLDEFVTWEGGADALAAARTVLAARPLPEDLELVSVGPESPSADLVDLDALTQSCEVLLPMGPFLRGIVRPAVCLFLRDRTGRAVAASAAIAQFHPDSPRAGVAWWGMLATDPARRGEGLALMMGARSMLAMHERHGHRQVFTGIRSGNAPSEKLCRKLGLTPQPTRVVLAIDTAALGGDRLTK